MKTISLKGREYAPVSARVEQFHKDYADGSITTETTFAEGHVIVKATVSFSASHDAPTRTFNGHSYGTVKGEKAFEKLETTAVGRALAFAGYLAGGEIASYDEMQEFVNETSAPDGIDKDAAEDYCHKLKVCTSLDSLKKAWESFPAYAKNDPEVLAMKEEMKKKLNK